MNNSFGHIPEDVLDFALTQKQIEERRAVRARRNKEDRARMLAARKKLKAQREQARRNRPKKTWGNFLR